MKIAITGSIGSGKSSLSKIIQDMGYPVYDTDKMVHAYYEPQGAAYHDLLDAFGPSIVSPSGSIDRKVLSDVVFRDKEKLKQLESLVYPHLQEEILSRADDGLIFYEVPVLYESGFDVYFDAVVMVAADIPLTLQRLEKRGMDEAEAKRRLSHQMSPQLKIEKADYLIQNDGDLQALESAAKALLNTLKLKEAV